MLKKYSIELPIYSRPVEQLAKVNLSEEIEIIVYGGIPNSPFNGGRMNSMLDGVLLWDRRPTSLSARQLQEVMEKFYATVSEINEKGMSFNVACTNIFVSEDELTEENLYPFKWLVESGQKHGVKNGIIVNNALLEERIRREYRSNLAYTSSCTKYVSPHKILSPRDTLAMYKEDCGKYDYVVLTPQDSRREKLMKNAASENKEKIVAIANSYCSNGCNTYHHYECVSKQNKRSLLSKSTDWQMIMTSVKFIPHTFKCSAYLHAFVPVEVEKLAMMQLNAGIVNFKLGRGFGVERFEKLVELTLKFEALPKETAVSLK